MVTGGIVLAGGRSTRMGRDKALVTVNGTPMALRTASVLTQSGCAFVHVVGRQSALDNLGLSVIPDPITDIHHPLLGVAAALISIEADLLLFAPCDLINLETQHVQALLSRGEPCVGAVNGQVHPLLAVLPKDQGKRAQRFAMEGRSAREFVDGLPIVELPLPNINDANRPSDLPR